MHSDGFFHSLFRDNPVPICLARAGDNVILEANESFLALAGRAREEVLGQPTDRLWRDIQSGGFGIEGATEGSLRDGEVVFRSGGGERRILRLASRALDLDGTPCRVIDLFDITEEARATSITRGQTQVLESITRDDPLEETLEILVRVVERQHEDMLASVLLLDPDGVHVRHGAAPSLPWEYVQAIDGQPIGPKAGSCGTAMFTGQPVIATDIRIDPLWETYRGAALAHGLLSCWSTPILSREGKVLGSFAMYHREARGPQAGEYAHIAVAVKVAGIAIERKRASEALHRSEERFRSMVENISDVVFATDTLGTFTYVSPAIRALAGREPAELIGRAYIDFVVPEDASIVTDVIDRRLQGSTEFLEYRIAVQGGESRWVRCSTRPIVEHGAVTGLRGVMVDIHSRKLAEEEVKRSQVLLQSVIDTSLSVISAKDTEGRYLLTNRRFREIYGLGPEAVVGRTDFELFGPDRAQARSDLDRRAMAERATLESEEVLPLEDGPHTFLTLRCPLQDASGTAFGVCCMMTDITGLKRVEEQLRQAQKMEAIGRLAGGIAHDFNNLLTAINGYASLGLSRIDSGRPERGYLEEILRSGERAATLTRQLLAYGRKQILAPAVLDMNAIVRDMQGLLVRVIGENVRLATSLDLGLRPVKADRGQMEQVLLNLVVNARDAMPEGGDLTLGTANVVLSAADARALDLVPGPYVRTWVSDTGSGMTTAVQSRLFEPFFTTKPVGKGTGLGLSVVYGILKQSGGGVAAASAPGKGTTISFYLPAVMAPETVGEPVPGTSGAEGGEAGEGETVLLVEDEDGVRTFAALALRSLGYRVVSAAEGVEALRIVEREGDRIHLVVTDVVMPGLGGRELVADIRRTLPGLPAVYISGYDSLPPDQVPEDARGAFLQKPFTPSELAVRVRQALGYVVAGTPGG